MQFETLLHDSILPPEIRQHHSQTMVINEEMLCEDIVLFHHNVTALTLDCLGRVFNRVSAHATITVQLDAFGNAQQQQQLRTQHLRYGTVVGR